MEWTRPIDAYCERQDPGVWAEPVNAAANAAFLLAAIIMWRRTGGQGLAGVLCVILAATGFGSFLFHTYAQAWAAIADVLPVLAYILVYIFAVNRDVWRLRPWPAAGLTALFFPFALATVPLFRMLPGLGSSAAYAPVPLLILVYAWLLRRRFPETARGLAAGACLLILSITFRAIDLPLCGALMLGWMIEVYHRHLAR